MKNREDCERGIDLYHKRRFTEASVEFNRVLSINPKDKAARIYPERSARHMVHAPPEDWDGVETLTEK